MAPELLDAQHAGEALKLWLATLQSVKENRQSEFKIRRLRRFLLRIILFTRSVGRAYVPGVDGALGDPGVLSGLRRYHVAEIELRIGPDDVRRQRLLVKIKAVQHIVRTRISFG